MLELKPIKETYRYSYQCEGESYTAERHTRRILGWTITLFIEENHTSQWEYPSKEQHQKHIEEFKIYFPEIIQWINENNVDIKYQELSNMFKSGTETKVYLKFNNKWIAKKFHKKWSNQLNDWLPFFKNRNGINHYQINATYNNILHISSTITDSNLIKKLFPYYAKNCMQGSEVSQWLKNNITKPFLINPYDNTYIHFNDVSDFTHYKLVWC